MAAERFEKSFAQSIPIKSGIVAPFAAGDRQTRECRGPCGNATSGAWPACPGRGAVFFTLLRRAGTVTNAAFVTAPGSAAHRKSAALRPGHAPHAANEKGR